MVHIVTRIGYIYARPLMYGGTPEGVDLTLYDYHHLWSFIVDREEDFQAAYHEVLREAECGSANFAHRYELDHPGASPLDAVAFSVQHWKTVSRRLGIEWTEMP